MILVLTGGIGSGKSTAAGILNEVYGYPVYDADTAVKRLYVTDPELLSDIEGDAGHSFRDLDGKFSPKLLAEWIFRDIKALEMVERRVFPALIKDFETWCTSQESPVVIFESATILEKDAFKGFGDAVIIVDAPVETRIERAMNRDGASRDHILARMENQKLMNDISHAGNIPKDAYICINNGGIDCLRRRLEEIIEKVNNK